MIPYSRTPNDPFPNACCVCPNMFDNDLSSNWHGPSGTTASDPNNILANLPADKISVTLKVSIFSDVLMMLIDKLFKGKY